MQLGVCVMITYVPPLEKKKHDTIHNWCTNSHHIWWFELNAHFDRKVVAFANCREKISETSETSFWNNIQLVVYKMQRHLWNDLLVSELFFEKKPHQWNKRVFEPIDLRQRRRKKIVLLQRSHLIPLFQKLEHTLFIFLFLRSSNNG